MPTALANPFPIESAPRQLADSDVPLFLIHDGGGTIVSYTMLGSLRRTVYGIHNPRFYVGGFFKGGILEMAAHYTDLIKSTVPEGGKLLLGGWSLGGILSNQIAHNFASSSDSRHVLGIIMLDSPCPLSWSSTRKTATGSPSFSAATNSETRDRVVNCMKHSGEMLRSWSLPQWRDESSGIVTHVPPPSVLIRCREYAPVPEGTEEGIVSRVDVARESATLGWDVYWKEQGFARLPVLETEGHHYNLFAPLYLDGVTAQISKACDMVLKEAEGGLALQA